MNKQFHPAPRLKYRFVDGIVAEFVKVTEGEGRRSKCVGWRLNAATPELLKDDRAREVASVEDVVERVFLWNALIADPKNGGVLYDARASWKKAKELLS